MKNKLTIVKVGGGILNENKVFKKFLKNYSQIKGFKLLVHGGGIIASQYMIRLGIPVKMINGRRITDSNALNVAVMTYAGLINKSIVSVLQGYNCNALGLCGADANIITSKIRENNDIDFGLVGDIVNIETNFIQQLLELKISPIICSLTHKVTLKYCFDKTGILIDPVDELSIKKTINKFDYQQLNEKNIITDGMIPKIDNCFHALENGVNDIYIGDHDIINSTKNCTKIIL
jgi:acetylglutamate kinase